MEEEKPINRYILITIVAVVLMLAVLLWLFGKSGDDGLNQVPEPPNGQTPEDALPEEVAGDVGEVLVPNEETGEQEPIVSAVIPEIVFYTAGEIIEINTDHLIINGNGSNFADGASRELKCFFDDSLVISDANRVKYTKNNGLALLQPSKGILIYGAENLRGKTEFKIKSIELLEN